MLQKESGVGRSLNGRDVRATGETGVAAPHARWPVSEQSGPVLSVLVVITGHGFMPLPLLGS